MAWQTPPDWENGMTVNAGHLDIINNNLLDLNTRLTNNTADTELLLEWASDSVGPSISNLYGGVISWRAELTSSRSITEGLNVSFDRVVQDFNGVEDTNPIPVSGYQVTPGQRGLYLVIGQAVFGPQPSSDLNGVYIVKNGTGGASNGVAAFEVNGFTDKTVIQTSGLVFLDNNTDWIGLRAWSNNSTELWPVGSYGGTYLAFTKIADPSLV